LGDSAASRKREIAPKKEARAERTERGDQNPPPSRSPRWIHTGRESSSHQDKRHYDQANQSADHQAEDERKLVFALSKSFQAPTEVGNPRLSLVDIHRLVCRTEAAGYYLSRRHSIRAEKRSADGIGESRPNGPLSRALSRAGLERRSRGSSRALPPDCVRNSAYAPRAAVSTSTVCCSPARLLRGKTTCVCSGTDGGGAAWDTAALSRNPRPAPVSIVATVPLPATNLARDSGVSTGAIMTVAARMGSSRAVFGSWANESAPSPQCGSAGSSASRLRRAPGRPDVPCRS